MSRTYRWDKDSPVKEEARERVRDAIAHTFNDAYGTDVDDLDAWHNLCQAVGINPPPDDIPSCRAVSRCSDFAVHNRQRGHGLSRHWLTLGMAWHEGVVNVLVLI